MTDRATPLPCFAVCAPGLEPVLEAELRALRIDGRREPGGVAWEAPIDTVYAANLELRTATRVVVRIAGFRARTFFELERHARRVPWARYLRPGRPVEWRVTCRKSRLYHEGAVAERLQRAIEEALGPSATAASGSAAAPAGDPEESAGEHAQLFVVRFHRDQCAISVDSSGAPLFMRGYRKAVAKAPLRESLAAAMLRASGWTGREPLVDPLCGSGTVPIEAALIARRIAPGLAGGGPRRFAFEQWPGFDAELWATTVAAARARILARAPVALAGADRDAGAIAAARANAERAGVLHDVRFDQGPISALRALGAGGFLVTNPPYGARVGDPRTLRDLYATIGSLARAQLAGGTVALLSADPALDAQLALPLREAFRTLNGGIPVRLVVGDVPPP